MDLWLSRKSFYLKNKRIKTWIDKGSGQNNLIGDITDTQPNVVFSSLNGYPTIDFPVTGLSLRTENAFGVLGSADRTLITVQADLLINTGVNVPGQCFGIDYSTAWRIIYLPYHYKSDNIIRSRLDLFHRWNINVVKHKNGVSQGWINGSLEGNASPIHLNTQLIPLTIGTRNPGDGLSHSGSIAEILYFSKALSKKERTLLERYLSKKWRIDIIEDDESTNLSGFTPDLLDGLDSWYDTSDQSTIVLL